MRIGTAVPETYELEAAPHHFIQNRSIFEDYNVGDFEKNALDTLDQLFQKHDVVIMVGGSGLYVDAVIKGFDEFPKVDPKIRKTLNHRLQKEGLTVLQEELKKLDPETHASIALDNPQRVTRALEVCIGSGQSYSSFKNKPKRKRNFHSIKVGLNGDRQKIYDRINLRVDIMIKNGLIEEAQSLVEHRQLNALQTVGYRELFTYFDGEFTKEFAIEEIKKNTRRFAKRQLTWFRKDESILWFDFQIDRTEIINILSGKL